MLAWPAFALLRTALPSTRITALVPAYTSSLARLCPSLDDILVVPESIRDADSARRLSSDLSSRGFDSVISFYSHYYTAWAFRRAGITIRIAPRTKLAQIHHTHGFRQHRSRSLQPEYRYNLDLAAYAIRLWGCERPPDPSPPYLLFSRDLVLERSRILRCRYGIPDPSPIIAIHPGQGGSANQLEVDEYAKICKAIAQRFRPPPFFLLTAGPSREDDERAQALSLLLERSACAHVIHRARHGLEDFALDLSTVSLFLSGSTGPLHLVGAMEIPTIGFYPARRSASALRWHPPCRPESHLGLTCLTNPSGRLVLPSEETRDLIMDFVTKYLR